MTKRFARFDYGSASKNMEAYGTPDYPDFPLGNISPNATIVLMRGATDIMARPEDIEILRAELKPTGANVVDHLIDAEKFSHADFVMGIGTSTLVNDPTLKYLDQYTEN